MQKMDYPAFALRQIGHDYKFDDFFKQQDQDAFAPPFYQVISLLMYLPISQTGNRDRLYQVA